MAMRFGNCFNSNHRSQSAYPRNPVEFIWKIVGRGRTCTLFLNARKRFRPLGRNHLIRGDSEGNRIMGAGRRRIFQQPDLTPFSPRKPRRLAPYKTCRRCCPIGNCRAGIDGATLMRILPRLQSALGEVRAETLFVLVNRYQNQSRNVSQCHPREEIRKGRGSKGAELYSPDQLFSPKAAEKILQSCSSATCRLSQPQANLFGQECLSYRDDDSLVAVRS